MIVLDVHREQKTDVTRRGIMLRGGAGLGYALELA